MQLYSGFGWCSFALYCFTKNIRRSLDLLNMRSVYPLNLQSLDLLNVPSFNITYLQSVYLPNKNHTDLIKLRCSFIVTRVDAHLHWIVSLEIFASIKTC